MKFRKSVSEEGTENKAREMVKSKYHWLRMWMVKGNKAVENVNRSMDGRSVIYASGVKKIQNSDGGIVRQWKNG